MKRSWFSWTYLVCAALVGCQGQAKDLSATQLSAVIDAARPALQKCYQEALDKSPRSDELRLQAVIHVETGGDVSSLELDLKDAPALSDCIGRVIGGLKFPAAEASTHASLPLVFRPEVAEAEAP